jgi:hypothetical protein
MAQKKRYFFASAVYSFHTSNGNYAGYVCGTYDFLDFPTFEEIKDRLDKDYTGPKYLEAVLLSISELSESDYKKFTSQIINQ